MTLSGRISIEVFAQFEAAEQMHPEVFSAEAAQELFYSPHWFRTLERYGNTLPGTTSIIVATDETTGTKLGLPVVAGKKSLRGLSNYYASLFGPLGDQSVAGPALCDAIAGWIRRQGQRWPIIDFSPLDTAQPFYHNMQSALSGQGYSTDSYFCFGNWFHETGGQNFEQYVAGRPSALRNTIRRNARKAEKSGETDIAIHCRPGDALETAIRQFHDIYRRSWKPPESHPDFITEFCRLAAHRGWLRLGMLTYRREPIAAQIWFTHAGKANIFKLAHVEGHNPFSAGTLLTHQLMRQAIDIDHVSEIDYLTGDDSYKSNWMSKRRERRGLIAFNLRTMHGLAAYARHQMGKTCNELKNLKRRH